MSAVSHAFQTVFADLPVEARQEVVCHCLRIGRNEVEAAIDNGACTVKCVIRETGAGGGCTACHCTIRNLLEAAGRTVVCRTPHVGEYCNDHAVAGRPA